MKTEKHKRSLLEIVREYATSEKMGLPVFPAIANELQQVMAEDDVPLDQIARIIERDQALASQILKVANSAAFAGFHKVRTIREALMRLGMNQVFNCLIMSSQQDLYKSKNGIIDNYLKILWRHALATGIGSKWLLRKTGHGNLADEGFLAGLLHDIGKLLLLRVVERVNEENSDIRLTEEFVMKILDYLHVQQGYYLMEEWSIPENYCIVTRDHHAQVFDTENVLLLAVRIVNQVCRKMGVSLHPDPDLDPAALPEVRALGVKDDVLAELETVIEEAMEQELAT